MDESKALYFLKVLIILAIAAFLIGYGATRPTSSPSNTTILLNISGVGELKTNNVGALEMILGALIVIAVVIYGKFKKKPVEDEDQAKGTGNIAQGGSVKGQQGITQEEKREGKRDTLTNQK